MKIEKFNDSNKKIKLAFVIGVVLTALLFIIVNLLTSKAKYQNSETVKIVEGKVNYILPDLNVVAAYQKDEQGTYQKIEDIPKSGYKLNKDDSYCTIPNDNTPIKTMLEFVDGKLTVDINKKGTKCYLYFEKKVIKNAQELLEDVKTKYKGYKDTFTEAATTDEGIYNVSDGMYGGASYYWRGAVTDNYVHFAGFYWRIIRINGDGTLRLIYDGTTKHKSGESNTDRHITTSKAFNSSYNKAEFVGLKYKEGDAHGSTTASTILGSDSDATSLYGWYKANIKDKGYEDKVDQNGLFCSDRVSTPTSSQTWEDWKKTKTDAKATGSTTTYYGARMRFYPNGSAPGTQTPTLECIGGKNDIFSKSGVTKGNESLTYPVGLITADEVIFAGGFAGQNNTSYYLYTGSYYWTMSPFYFYCYNAGVFFVYDDGYLGNNDVGNTRGVRPVINLRADTTFSSGNGSYDSPFEVSD